MSSMKQKDLKTSNEIEDPKNFFDILSDVLLKKSKKRLTETQTFKKHMSSFMLCRYLSMRDELLPYIAIMQKNVNVLSSEQFYKWCYDVIPKQKNGFIKYMSKPKKE